MLTDLVIENYQSLANVQLRLGKFTVITGRSSAGKSALIRALRMLAFNARGTAYITHGQKTAKVMAGCQDEGWAVAITRGSRGSDSYRLATLGGDGSPVTETFTKLAGKVPEAVTDLLRLSEVNFAGQFDRPYLLDGSGGEVARTLGALTNVTVIFKAAAEANTRRLRFTSQLADAEAELAELHATAQQFAGRKERQQAAEGAAQSLARAQEARSTTQRLAQAISRAEAAQGVLAQVAVPEVPSTERLDALVAQRARLGHLAGALETALAGQGLSAKNVRDARARQADAESDLHDLLVAAGCCPTCGQEVCAD